MAKRNMSLVSCPDGLEEVGQHFPVRTLAYISSLSPDRMSHQFGK